MMNRFFRVCLLRLCKNWPVPLAAAVLIAAVLYGRAEDVMPEKLLFYSLLYVFVFASVSFPAKTKRLWLIPMFLLLPVICVPGLVALISCSAFLSMSAFEFIGCSFPGTPAEQTVYSLLSASLAAGLIVWLLWVAYICWRGTSPRHSAIRFFNILLISLVLWCLMLGVQTIRANNTAAKALSLCKPDFPLKKTKDGEELLSLLKETEKFHKQMKEKYPNFVPPCCGVYSWTGREPDRLSASDLRRKKEQIQETLAKWNSPEVKRFFASLDRYGSLLPFSGGEVFVETEDLQILNSLRSFARYQAGRAQVAHYQGRKKDILPPLEKISPFGQALSGSHMIISELLRCAVFAIQYNNYVNLGPTGPEYVDFYRRVLNSCLEWSISVPDELECYLYGMQYKLAHINRKPEKIFVPRDRLPFLLALLLRPVELNREIIFVKNAMAVREIIPQLIELERFPNPDDDSLIYETLLRYLETGRISEFDWNRVMPGSKPGKSLSPVTPFPQKKNAVKLLGKSRCVKALAVTGIALKLYKCLHGAYPERLDLLVPEILKALPDDPYTGKPFRYALKDGEFTLQSGCQFLRLGSEAGY